MLVGRCVPNANWSSALIGRCALISMPGSTVGGKLTNHERLDLAAIVDDFTHFCFVVSILHAFETSVHIISDAKTACIAAYNIAFYGNMRTFTSITQRSLIKLISYRRNLSVIGALLSI